jgi:intracellular sulfur oxidation DsrE/DsrF family protein
MKRLVPALTAIWLALAPLAGLAQGTAPTPAFGPGAQARYRVVMQVSNPEPRGWHQALNNALALTRNAGRANVQIEIVANGMGLGMLKYNSSEAREVAAALEQGIKVVACGETMKALMLEKDDMLPDISYVPGGLIEVLDRQRDGWQYIKAD